MPTIQQHFNGRDPNVRTIYDRILNAAGSFGPFTQEAKKTSIHLVPARRSSRRSASEGGRRSAFAGIATRKNALILTVKSPANVPSNRIFKRLQASASRWYLEIRLEKPAQVDAELKSWLKQSIELST
jgi:Domain of unknown function (DUF5655)